MQSSNNSVCVISKWLLHNAFSAELCFVKLFLIGANHEITPHTHRHLKECK